MKFKDPITGEYKTLHLKTGDTLPVGTIVSFEGDEIPEGYEEVIGEEARVVISSTEPTTGEEVWIQKSKNLFNINGDYASVVGSPTISDNSITLPNSDGNAGYTKFLKKIEISGPITISFDVSNSDGFARLLLIPLDINGNVITNLTIDGYTYLDVYKGYYKDHINGNYELVLNFPENVKYFQLGFVHTIGTFANVQIEQGEIATKYEPYTDKKIYIKNENGVYDKFLDENELKDEIEYVKNNTVETKGLGQNPDINSLHYMNGVYSLYQCSQAPSTNMGILEVLVYNGDWVIQRFTDVVDAGKMWQRVFQKGTTWTEWTQKW